LLETVCDSLKTQLCKACTSFEIVEGSPFLEGKILKIKPQFSGLISSQGQMSAISALTLCHRLEGPAPKRSFPGLFEPLFHFVRYCFFGSRGITSAHMDRMDRAVFRNVCFGEASKDVALRLNSDQVWRT
jgi:hypothetical protein